jgi:hypothetical protein
VIISYKVLRFLLPHVWLYYFTQTDSHAIRAPRAIGSVLEIFLPPAYQTPNLTPKPLAAGTPLRHCLVLLYQAGYVACVEWR